VAVTDLLAAIEANRGIKLERSQIDIADALKEVGEYEAKIDLGHDVFVKFKITILDEEAEG
jgi:ribosomal protein L9